MAREYTPQTLPFGNLGHVLKLDPSLLQLGQYQRLVNLVSLQEGAIVTRNGYRRLNPSGFVAPEGFTIGVIHTLNRIAIQESGNVSGMVNTAGQEVFWVSGNVFDPAWAPGTFITINGVDYAIAEVRSTSWIILAPGLSPGTQTGVSFEVQFQQSGYRYFGENGGAIYRIAQINNPPLYEAVAHNVGPNRKWTSLSYRKYTSGAPYQYFATSQYMLRDPLGDRPFGALGPLQRWGLDRPVYPAIAQVFGGGNLKGPNAYQWVYTLRNPITNHEGNPSPIQLTSEAADPVNGTSFNITVSPISPAPQDRMDFDAFVDPQTSSTDSIAIYRKGGAFFDGLYRLVGYATPNSVNFAGTVNVSGTTVTRTGGASFDSNWEGFPIVIDTTPVYVARFVDVNTIFVSTPPAQGNGLAFSIDIPDSGAVTFYDNTPDDSIAGARTVQFDNDPPVTASLPIPFTATMDVPGTGNYTINRFTVTVFQGMPPGETSLARVLRPGTTLQVGSGDNLEFCTLWAITGPLEIQLVFQKDHAAGETIQTASIANQPCSLLALAFECMFVAGDPDNPSILYKSKPGRPESFPVVNLEDQTSGSVEVGSPGNPIMAIVEFGGEIISLNRSNIYEVRVWNGALQAPITTPAQRGLFGRNAWCKADNEIWYLSYDGIYAWGGAQSVKHSEAIDSIFKGETVNGFRPISMSTVPDQDGVSDLDRIELHYYQNQIFVLYRDLDGFTHRLRYHMLYDRWSADENDANNVPTTMFFEEDLGTSLLATSKADGSVAYLNLDNSPISNTIAATTDGWTNATQSDGTAVSFEAKTGFFTMQLPSTNKQWGDIILELQNPADTVTVQTFYDFSATPDATDTFTITAVAGRRRFVMPLNSGNGREAYAIAFRITGTATDPTTFYTLTFNWFPLEQVQLGRAFDWDNLGWPHDKKLTQCSVEYDVAGSGVVLNMDTVSGVLGNTTSLAVQLFSILNPAATAASGPLRGRTSFPINDDIVVKLVRLRPNVPPSVFKFFNYKFDFWQYPADIALFTEWEDLGYGCDKLFREVILTIDTLSTDCTVRLWLDGVIRQSWSIRTSSRDRRRVLTCASEVIGKNVRLTFEPNANGKSQLFAYSYNWIPEPCAVYHWDSYETSLDYNLYKFIKQISVEYRCDSSLTFSVYRDKGQLLWQQGLPRHEHRNTHRFYLPVKSQAGVLNKSKIYRFTLDPCNVCAPFFLYRDGTRVEFMPIGGDQRQSFVQSPLFEPIPIKVQ